MAAPLLGQPHETLSALLACDTLSDLDGPIKKDAANLKILLREITRYTGLRVDQVELFGNDLSADSVQFWLENVKKSSPEIVLIYYSGHGYRTALSPTSWPYLFFSVHEETLDPQTLWNDLSGAGPRLVIVLLDCCNRISTRAGPTFSVMKKGAGWENKNRPGFKTLFLRTQGTVIATGASPGEPAFALDNGSLFTTSFTQTIRALTSNKNVSWRAVFDRTISLCSYMQRPVCSVQTTAWVPKGKHSVHHAKIK